MYWIKKNNEIKKGYENESGFRGFVSLAELKAKTKKDQTKIDVLLKEAGVFAWIKTKKGAIKKGSSLNQDFAEYATAEEVEKVGGELFQADIINSNQINDEQNKTKK